MTAEAGRLFDALDEVRVPVEGAPAVAVAELEGDRARIELAAAPPRPVPLWIRQGYLPNWTNESGAPVWLATPTFQLTFADRRETRMTFRRHPAALPGMLLSLAGVAGLVALGWGSLIGRKARQGWRRFSPAAAGKPPNGGPAAAG